MITKQDLFNFFGFTVRTGSGRGDGGTTFIAEKFHTSKSIVSRWPLDGPVPEVISLRAHYISDGELEHDPTVYGHGSDDDELEASE